MAVLPKDLSTGIRDGLPLIPAIAPFGIIVGIAAVNAGIQPANAVWMSVLMNEGASQLVAINLLQKNAPGTIIVLAAVIINLRFMMFSASLGVYFQDLSKRWRFGLPYFLVTGNYALSVTKFDAEKSIKRRWYYLGTSVPIWLSFVPSTAVGAYFGTSIPPNWHLDFVIPLMFLALLLPMIKDFGTMIAAVIGAVVAVAGYNVPYNASLLFAGVGGAVAGLVINAIIRRFETSK